MTEIRKKGLRQRINEAITEEKIEGLLKEGESYEFASPQIKRAWKKTADRRIEGIKNPPKKKGEKKEKEAEEKKP